MNRRKRALKINDELFSNTDILLSMNSNELLTLISAINGWELSEKDEKRIKNMEKKIERYKNTQQLSIEEAREIFDKIVNAKNKRAMRYYALKFNVSIAALVRVFKELPEKLLNESLFMYDGVKLPDGSVISKSEYEKLTGLKHYHRNHENFGKGIKIGSFEEKND